MGMDYNLLKCSRPEEAQRQNGGTRIGYAHIHFPSRSSGGDEHLYFDLRGLGRHRQKFRNWAKKEYADRTYHIFIP